MQLADLQVPSPADVPTMTARELVAEIRTRGGRVVRMKVPPSTFVLTNERECAEWLLAKGATMFTARGLKLDGSYKRSRGGIDEWDLWIHPIRVVDDDVETIWDVAGP